MSTLPQDQPPKTSHRWNLGKYDPLDMGDLAHQFLCQQCGASVAERVRDLHTSFHHDHNNAIDPRNYR